MSSFIVCIHDATPAYAGETRAIFNDLSRLIGRRVSAGVVPNWHREWPVTTHRDYCRLVQDSSEEILLHGYFHLRGRGWGPATLLAERSDEMNGLSLRNTHRLLERGQADFLEVFEERARGFLAPAWQPGRVRDVVGKTSGFEYTLGFFSMESIAGQRVPVATSTWDCGRWGWLGHAGHGLGWLLQSVDHGIPVLAIHPRDLERGFWPKILRLTEELLDKGCEPVTPGSFFATRHAEVAV